MSDLVLWTVVKINVLLGDPTSPSPSAPGNNVPNPGLGTQPPGTGGLNTLLSWAAWIVALFCVGGFVGVAGKMALMWQRNELGQHFMGLACVCGACVILGAASALAGALI